MPKIVELTSYSEGQKFCQDTYPNEEIIQLNPFEYVGIPLPYKDCTLGGIFAYWVLNRIPYRFTAGVVHDYARCLRPGAILHVFVPSAEWLARQLLQDKMKPHVRPLLFGTQEGMYDVGMNALRMADLRDYFDLAGLRAVKARMSIVSIQVGEETFEAEQHYVAGVHK
jgi:predicted SAM-dependent methyltransferase